MGFCLRVTVVIDGCQSFRHPNSVDKGEVTFTFRDFAQVLAHPLVLGGTVWEQTGCEMVTVVS